jgi:predicted membrane protein
MSIEQLTTLNASAQGLLHMVYVLIGVAFGAIVIWIVHNIIVTRNEREKKNGKEQDDGITPSPTKLESSLETFKDVKQSLTILNDYVQKAKNIMDGKQNDKKEQGEKDS